uniref:ATP synthase complex subunit 8 n=1 Tax=Rhizomys sinensis TaxID=146130 RepID=A0A0U1XY22_RHISI|nr:ATP synthase F0 subunit 8 [Rhizomys sinensis]AJA05056.1 ATPase subunit 8 [Rhizomys sinensis]
MPQLDTSTWATMITFSLITLFSIFQPKLSNFNFLPLPYFKPKTLLPHPSHPWTMKWTKIYSPLSLPPHL